jgi:hypothetical protein
MVDTPREASVLGVVRRDFPTQSNFPTKYWTTVLSIPSTHEWLRGTWGFYVYFDRGFGLADVSAASVERSWELSVRIPQECIGRCTCELQIPHSALHKLPHTCLSCKHKIHSVQVLRPSGHPLYYAFVTGVFERLNEDSWFLKRMVLMTRLLSMCQGESGITTLGFGTLRSFIFCSHALILSA